MRLFPFRFEEEARLAKLRELVLVFGRVTRSDRQCVPQVGRFLQLDFWLHFGSLPPYPYIGFICLPGYAHTRS